MWTKEVNTAFKEFKVYFTTAPILRLYDFFLFIRIETDASGYIIAGIISQVFADLISGRKVWYFITYFSRKISSAERNYAAHNVELLAIIKSFREWRCYLEGAQYFI